jgi:hypothetical protein
MTIQHFYATLKLPQGGDCEMLRASMEDSLEEFWKSITVDI